MIFGHGGNIVQIAKIMGCNPEEIVDMSSNVNPIGPPPGLEAYLKKRIDQSRILPEVDAASAVGAFADRYGLNPMQVIPGNGTTQLIYMIPRALGFRKVMIVGPTYADYLDACRMAGTNCRQHVAVPERMFVPDLEQIKKAANDTDAVFICNPNNPTGTLISADPLKDLIQCCPETIFIVDESYLPFVAEEEKASLIATGFHNLIVLHSMSKVFRIPGLRIGFAISDPSVIDKLKTHFLPWSVNGLAQIAVSYLMEKSSQTQAFINESQLFLKAERHRFTQNLAAADCMEAYPSSTSFVLIRLYDNLNASVVCEDLLKDKILIRNCSNFTGLSQRYIRISLKDPAANTALADKLLTINNLQKKEKPAGQWKAAG